MMSCYRWTPEIGYEGRLGITGEVQVSEWGERMDRKNKDVSFLKLLGSQVTTLFRLANISCGSTSPLPQCPQECVG